MIICSRIKYLHIYMITVSINARNISICCKIYLDTPKTHKNIHQIYMLFNGHSLVFNSNQYPCTKCSWCTNIRQYDVYRRSMSTNRNSWGTHRFLSVRGRMNVPALPYALLSARYLLPSESSFTRIHQDYVFDLYNADRLILKVLKYF